MSGGSRQRVPAGLYWKTRAVAALPRLWRVLGRLESAVLREELEAVAIDRPIYVTGLARAGTTIVTELIHAHPDVTSHHYADFPLVDVPFWRNWLHVRTRVAKPEPVERAHRDRIMVTEDSPEAVEEWLWRAHFPHRHDPTVDQRLGPADRNPAFDRAYRDHIRKLLLVRGARRYLAKGNYNIARLAYLLALFPTARFVVPVRDPVAHVASLAKQHALFLAAARDDPRTRFQLRASGHFEFGCDRTATHCGDEAATRAILAAWAGGDEAGGWACLWAATYGYLLDQLAADRALAEAVLLVPYADLCANSGPWIDRILAHCALAADPFVAARERFSALLSPPAYYESPFDAGDRDRIRALTDPVRARLPFDL